MSETLVDNEVREPVRMTRYHSRCDRCGSAGYVMVEKNDQDLIFCGHHFAQHEDALITSGFAIVADTREDLLRPHT